MWETIHQLAEDPAIANIIAFLSLILAAIPVIKALLKSNKVSPTIKDVAPETQRSFVFRVPATPGYFVRKKPAPKMNSRFWPITLRLAFIPIIFALVMLSAGMFQRKSTNQLVLARSFVSINVDYSLFSDKIVTLLLALSAIALTTIIIGLLLTPRARAKRAAQDLVSIYEENIPVRARRTIPDYEDKQSSPKYTTVPRLPVRATRSIQSNKQPNRRQRSDYPLF